MSLTFGSFSLYATISNLRTDFLLFGLACSFAAACHFHYSTRASVRAILSPVLNIRPESIEWSIENQALLPSYDTAPPPPCPVGKMSLFLSLPMCGRSSLLRGGVRANHTTARMLVLFKSFNTLWFRPSVHCTVYNVQHLFYLWFLSNKVYPFRASQHHVNT